MSENHLQRSHRLLGSIWRLLGAVVLIGGGLALAVNDQSTAEEGRRIPTALHDIASTEASQTAVLAGGCFWGVQAVFQHVAGVTRVTSGYAGGSAATATYELTETGTTGHAEAVEITFDPKQVSYGQLLEVYFSVAHDPTQLGRQGPDVGPQYRSAIFPRDHEQAKVAADYIAQLDTAGAFGRAIATTIEPGKSFYKAEAHHQDYVYNNPRQPYVVIYEQPKIGALHRLFPGLYREKPVLVADSAL
ncbi:MULTISPECIES: peptide-methionine (S)-S-oxide reductase MsrA [unclassified Ensifer]|uniref:peptide-methionine (S)-S-oxide reductase MsrA n=1 Tax=unclassified Ensifer TaxID=2633371 RepID=UPI00081330D0|nr:MULTISPECIES: peptide-methionine (S)-S-oxide reductase MsrA [unclassified Ensifer]OCO98422.1 peptide-methionine (S)-S-oxide reductase [Ensifer sp. LC11]OCP05600.1 peptide-methionine (S)-S-oxide reductase [Ensifer sp. LC13]OCP13527.1 peptide-methionine (S)-S-oxide reductase [Ensifer sp. LC14]OCP30770.1 peptide-methionine (S)-S-oxide reductase [Ensifer sp. LC499]